MTLEQTLILAASAYDRRQESKRGYNRYALAQYFARIDEVVADIAAGATVHAALVAAFTGPLLNAMLKAAGEEKQTADESRGRWVYVPASAS